MRLVRYRLEAGTTALDHMVAAHNDSDQVRERTDMVRERHRITGGRTAEFARRRTAWSLAIVVALSGCTAQSCSTTTSASVPAANQFAVPRSTIPLASDRDLRGDPHFEAAELPGTASFWHQRLLEGIELGGSELDPFELASSDDLYTYGRTLQIYVQSVLMAFRVTGDLTLLDHVDRIGELMRAELADGWRDTLDGSDGTRDGYRNWVWRYSSGDAYIGKDTNELDEMKAHAMVAMIAAALETNRDLPSPSGRDYAASADFWKRYLVDEFEAKWRERSGVPKGFPIMTRPHMHTYLSWIKWHYYMSVVTGDVAYVTEADRMANIWWAELRPVESSTGIAYVWPRSVLGIEGSQEYLMPTVYASSVYADVVELHREGFHRWASPDELYRFARTFTEFMMDSDDPIEAGVAADVGGGRPQACLPSNARNWPRMTAVGFGMSGFPFIAPWDVTGRIATFTDAVYERHGASTGLMLEAAALVDKARLP